MLAMTRNFPAQSGQASMSMANSRLRHCIQLMGATGSSQSTCSATVAAVMPDAKNQNDESLQKVERFSYSREKENQIGWA